MLGTTYYHRTLRTTALVVGLVLLFDSGIALDNSREISDGAVKYLANTVGIVATVPSNEVNTLAMELQARIDQVEQREREINAQARDSMSVDTSTYILSSILLLLLALIVTNYALDYIRERKRLTLTRA